MNCFTLKNIGSSKNSEKEVEGETQGIENWCLTFPLNETISNIWNVTVSKTHGDFYVIKNAGWNQDTAIEDWRLSFSYGDNLITQIWNAVILGNTEGKYELSCETYNQNIAPGTSVTFGFMVEPGCSGNLMENIKLSEVETDL